ncbi:MAG TPA: hypothetical protein VNO20_07615 [Solirubrobacterales bacterium]|nr:hypothetical protein [Solirubrobacterales bacterium]
MSRARVQVSHRRFPLGRRRAARKAEVFTREYEFPSHISRRVRRRYPDLDDPGWKLAERGLREWFICCAWRGRAVLGMPSRVVDEAWHEFLLDSIAYITFCDVAFGAYLHHTPDEAMATPSADLLYNTVRAWDRSDAGANAESVLWDLDEQLGIPEPLGVSGLQLSAARSGVPGAGGAAGAPGACGTGGSDGGSADGGGCGGGGCGGGGS